MTFVRLVCERKCLCDCMWGFFFLSHAIWAVAGPSGHHTADDQQRTEGQQHTAHTGTHKFTLFCI